MKGGRDRAMSETGSKRFGALEWGAKNKRAFREGQTGWRTQVEGRQEI